MEHCHLMVKYEDLEGEFTVFMAKEAG